VQRSVSFHNITLILTHDVEVEVVTLAVSFGIVAYTGVVACTVSTNSLQHQALIADDYSSPSPHVVAQQLTLQQIHMELQERLLHAENHKALGIPFLQLRSGQS
jgi:hypothetical protein